MNRLPDDLSALPTVTGYRPVAVVPEEAREGTWVGRAWVPAACAENRLAGPRVVQARAGVLHATPFATMTELINSADPAGTLRRPGRALASLDTVLAQTLFARRARRLVDESAIVLLAPNDLLATRACGVTFARSLLERVVEEKSAGDPVRAASLRALIVATLGHDLGRVVPGSPAAAALKEQLLTAGLWSQYLEVGIGPHAEIFTKAQPMASVGFGSQVGILPDSRWNNPEPEVVLAVSAGGLIRGATLGNDVNLRDYEGRSALLLGEAKDQNASCAIGPFIRLFDGTFSLPAITELEIDLAVFGADGFATRGRNRMAEISRPPASLVAQAIGRHHQYPDGLMLFLGTMFAPTDDRGAPGGGFAHRPGDRVEISAGPLGTLVNWVNHTDRIPRWDYGIGDLVAYLVKAGLPCQPST